MTQGFYQDGNLLMTFATPLLKRQWPESGGLNQRLHDVILENERRYGSGFPGWLQHWVHAFRGRGERISIAFNIKLRF